MKKILLLIILLIIVVGCSPTSIEQYTCEKLAKDIEGREFYWFGALPYQVKKVTEIKEISRTSTKLECFADRVITDLGDDSGVKFSVEIIDGDSFKYYQGQPF